MLKHCRICSTYVGRYVNAHMFIFSPSHQMRLHSWIHAISWLSCSTCTGKCTHNDCIPLFGVIIMWSVLIISQCLLDSIQRDHWWGIKIWAAWYFHDSLLYRTTMWEKLVLDTDLVNVLWMWWILAHVYWWMSQMCCRCNMLWEVLSICCKVGSQCLLPILLLPQGCSLCSFYMSQHTFCSLCLHTFVCTYVHTYVHTV